MFRRNLIVVLVALVLAPLFIRAVILQPAPLLGPFQPRNAAATDKPDKKEKK
jgi:hypothetical protein